MTTDFISLNSLKPAAGKSKPFGDWEPTGELVHIRPEQIVLIEPLEAEDYKLQLRDGRTICAAIDDDTLKGAILRGASPRLCTSTSPKRGTDIEILKAIKLGMRDWQKNYSRGEDPLFHDPPHLIYSSLETVYHKARELRIGRGLLPYEWEALSEKVEKAISSGYAEAHPWDYYDGIFELREVRLTRKGFRILNTH